MSPRECTETECLSTNPRRTREHDASMTEVDLRRRNIGSGELPVLVSRHVSDPVSFPWGVTSSS